jgi:hypothetical protein
MAYKIPDDWPLPTTINWLKCQDCGMLYGDGDFTQLMLNDYYRYYYGYGVNSLDVKARLEGIADEIASVRSPDIHVVDFGGSGDDGKSILCERLKSLGYANAYNVNAGETVPACDVLLASHVIEHVYDIDGVMGVITDAISDGGMLIVDGPDATGLLTQWGMPILDYQTKHINHFRMVDYLRLMERYGWEMVEHTEYHDVRSCHRARSYRMYFKRLDMAQKSGEYVQGRVSALLEKLREVGDRAVNVWGLGDITWHLLSQVKLNVLDYIDNDPAYRNERYDGKPVQVRPTNDAPIVILAQGQRQKLIENIRKAGVQNDIIEI